MTSLIDRIDEGLSDALPVSRRAWLRSPRTLIRGFIGLYVIFLLGLLPAILTGQVLGDLPLYRAWAQEGLVYQVWQGITVGWVYPIGALLPVVFADIAGPYTYQLLWFVMTAVLNVFAVGALTAWGRRASGYRAAWLWLLISLMLSPVGLLRLEGITAPIVIVALVLVARRPVVAGVLLTIATWIKVWPAAVFLAVIAVSPRRRTVALTGVAVTAVVAASVWIMGGLPYLAGFVTTQSDRALQLEAPVTTPWVWLAAIGHHGTVIYQNYAISTQEVTGPGTAQIAALMTPLMFVALAAIFVLLLVALRRGHDRPRLLLMGSLALVSAFVVFNKVGSPQYMLWIAPIITVGVLHDWRQWRVATYLMLVIAGLTTLIFPIFYLPLVSGDPLAVLVLTCRNALLVVMLGWSVRTLWRMARARATVVEAAAATAVEGYLGSAGDNGLRAPSPLAE
jgi:hypothetical protein